MNGVIGMTDLALETKLTAQQREYLEMVKTSADALLVIINDILDFSKIEAGKLEIEHVGFAIREEISQILKPLQFRAEQKGLSLDHFVDPSVPPVLIGDPVRLRQLPDQPRRQCAQIHRTRRRLRRCRAGGAKRGRRRPPCVGARYRHRHSGVQAARDL